MGRRSVLFVVVCTHVHNIKLAWRKGVIVYSSVMVGQSQYMTKLMTEGANTSRQIGIGTTTLRTTCIAANRHTVKLKRTHHKLVVVVGMWPYRLLVLTVGLAKSGIVQIYIIYIAIAVVVVF